MSLQKGKILDLRMDRGFKDSTPYENHGTATDVTLGADRKGNTKAGLFNGTSSYIDVGTIVPTIKSISLWCKPSSISTTEEIIDLNGTQYIKATNGVLSAEGFISPTIYVNSLSSNTITTDWQLITITTETAINASDVDIGRLEGSSFFTGSIERPQIWNRALSADEVKLLYESYNPCLKMTRALKGTFVDSRDGTEYKTIKIGNQTWMAENLKYLPSVVGSATGSSTDPYYYVYGYQGTDILAAKATDNYKTYGVLYNWSAALTACPSGWHLPTDAELNTLETYVVSYINSPNPQYPCSTSETGWRRCADNSGTDAGGTYGAGKSLKKVGQGTGVGAGDDLVGFSALLAGFRNTDGSFGTIGLLAHRYERTGEVLTTRGVDVDVAGLPALLDTPAAYIGLIGSRRRWSMTRKQLLEKGVSEEKLGRVRSPIGLELNAETPEEIAVSILAEVIMLQKGGSGQAMAAQMEKKDVA